LDLPDAVFGVLAAVMKKDAAELRRALLDLMDETERLWPGELQRSAARLATMEATPRTVE
jgi:hypothetical protein